MNPPSLPQLSPARSDVVTQPDVQYPSTAPFATPTADQLAPTQQPTWRDVILHDLRSIRNLTAFWHGSDLGERIDALESATEAIFAYRRLPPLLSSFISTADGADRLHRLQETCTQAYRAVDERLMALLIAGEGSSARKSGAIARLELLGSLILHPHLPAASVRHNEAVAFCLLTKQMNELEREVDKLVSECQSWQDAQLHTQPLSAMFGPVSGMIPSAAQPSIDLDGFDPASLQIPADFDSLALDVEQFASTTQHAFLTPMVPGITSEANAVSLNSAGHDLSTDTIPLAERFAVQGELTQGSAPAAVSTFTGDNPAPSHLRALTGTGGNGSGIPGQMYPPLRRLGHPLISTGAESVGGRAQLSGLNGMDSTPQASNSHAKDGEPSRKRPRRGPRGTSSAAPEDTVASASGTQPVAEEPDFPAGYPREALAQWGSLVEGLVRTRSVATIRPLPGASFEASQAPSGSKPSREAES